MTELEPWADEGDPTEADVRVYRVIDELKCFDVSPRKATLAPGEAVTLRFACVDLQLARVRRPRRRLGAADPPPHASPRGSSSRGLDLMGRTLARNEPLLVLPQDPTTGEMALHPVAVGTKPEEAPLVLKASRSPPGALPPV